MKSLVSHLLASPMMLEPRRGLALLSSIETAPQNRLSDGGGSPQVRGGIAVLEVSGFITRNVGGHYPGYWTDTAQLEADVSELARRDDVHTVVLAVNSPGGHAVGCFEAANLVRELASQKRVVAWVDDVAASAAYFIGCSAGEIYSIPTAIVGSIGTVLMLQDVSAWLEKIGIRIEAFSSAPGKLRAAPGRPFSDQDREFFQAQVDELGVQFRSWVAARRPGASSAALTSGDYGLAGSWGVANGLVDGVFLSFGQFAATVLF